MSDIDLKTEVFEHMKNALTNGYTFAGMTALQVAEDMVSCSQTFEGTDPDKLVPHIKEWRKQERYTGPDAPLNILIDEYAVWREKEGLMHLGSADEHLHDKALTDDQRAWLGSFSARWDEASQ